MSGGKLGCGVVDSPRTHKQLCINKYGLPHAQFFYSSLSFTTGNQFGHMQRSAALLENVMALHDIGYVMSSEQ
jgi:hypothetical protein